MAGVEHDVVRSSFIAFCVFSTLILFFLIIAIWKRQSWLGRMRMYNIIPLALGGAMATYHFNDIHGYNFRNQYQSQTAVLRAVYGLSAITMDFNAAWSIIVAFCFTIMKNKSKSTSTSITTLERKRSSTYFYLTIVDLAVLACLLASIVLARSFIPFQIKHCYSSKYTDSLMVALLARATREPSMSNACEKGFWIQSMTGISAAITALQIMLQLPLVNLPNGFRFAIFFAIRLFRRPRSPYRDLELGGGFDMPAIGSKTSDLEGEMAQLVEKHPHYADLVVAAAKESGSILSPKDLDLLARSACAGKAKSQCWACEGIICDDCTTSRSDVLVPRTTNHIVHCVAMCTACYLVKASSQPAAFSATFNPTDLSHQHRGCKFEEKKRAMMGEVSLCQACAKGTPEDISAMRETREERMLALSLRRVILCAECEKPIPKGKRRWWMCSQGDHDCHWGGHEVSRQRLGTC